MRLYRCRCMVFRSSSPSRRKNILLDSDCAKLGAVGLISPSNSPRIMLSAKARDTAQLACASSGNNPSVQTGTNIKCRNRLRPVRLSRECHKLQTHHWTKRSSKDHSGRGSIKGEGNVKSVKFTMAVGGMWGLKCLTNLRCSSKGRGAGFQCRTRRGNWATAVASNSKKKLLSTSAQVNRVIRFTIKIAKLNNQQPSLCSSALVRELLFILRWPFNFR